MPLTVRNRARSIRVRSSPKAAFRMASHRFQLSPGKALPSRLTSVMAWLGVTSMTLPGAEVVFAAKYFAWIGGGRTADAVPSSGAKVFVAFFKRVAGVCSGRIDPSA